MQNTWREQVINSPQDEDLERSPFRFRSRFIRHMAHHFVLFLPIGRRSKAGKFDGFLGWMVLVAEMDAAAIGLA